jgi:hypothetical protein
MQDNHAPANRSCGRRNIVKEHITKLRSAFIDIELTAAEANKIADALERMVAELETANRIKTAQIDYAIGLQRAIEAHCREELAPEDVCPHHAEKLNEHFNRQQVLEKEHTEFYSEVVTLRSTVEHLRLRENRLTAELAAEQGKSAKARLHEMENIRPTAEHNELQDTFAVSLLRVKQLEAERDALIEGLDGWHARYLDMEVDRDSWIKQCDQRIDGVLRLGTERDALRADAVLYYNSGYMAGHHDTVESQFTDIHQSDMRTYHADVVAAIAGEKHG